MTRAARARPVLAQQRQWLRKRYAAIVAAILIPAIASAADWPSQPEQAGLVIAPNAAEIHSAAYQPLGDGTPIHSDTESSSFVRDAIGGPAAKPSWSPAAGSTAPAPNSA